VGDHDDGDRVPGGAGSPSAQTLDRGLRLLRLLALPEHGRGLTVTELATQLGVGRTIVYRLLGTLTAHELVARDSSGRVHLGLGVVRLSGGLLPRLREAAAPALRALAEEVGATAHLTIVEGGDSVAVLVVEPTWTDYHVAYRVGSRHPVGQGAAGKAILAGREGRLEPVASSGELQAGAHGVAAPLPGGGPLEASVGVVALHELDVGAVGPAVQLAARRVADVLG
jgi:DNA-binding IclR family transcriptional regulator